MPIMNFDLEDGKPPVSFSINNEGAERFMEFMAECQAIRDSVKQADAAQVGPTEAEYAAVFANDSLDEVMKERDHYHDIADGLAESIAEYFGADIGEHSSANCPWAEALRVIEESLPLTQRVVSETVPAAFPALPTRIWNHPVLGEMWDRIAMHQYAMKYATAYTTPPAAPVALSDAKPAAWIIKYPDGVVIPLIGETVPKVYAPFAIPLYF